MKKRGKNAKEKKTTTTTQHQKAGLLGLLSLRLYLPHYNPNTNISPLLGNANTMDSDSLSCAG